MKGHLINQPPTIDFVLFAKLAICNTAYSFSAIQRKLTPNKDSQKSSSPDHCGTFHQNPSEVMVPTYFHASRISWVF